MSREKIGATETETVARVRRDLDFFTIPRRDPARSLGDFLDRIVKRINGGWRIVQVIVKYEQADE